MKRLLFSFVSVMVLSFALMAQSKKVQVILVPDHADALYKVGEPVKMKVIALDCGLALNDVVVDYEVSEDLMPVHASKQVKLKGNEASINVGTMKKSGFLRVKASVKHEGNTYYALKTVGFEPEKLMPYSVAPADFDEFWNSGLEQLGKVELRPKMELLPNRCNDKVDAYHISYGNINNTRMYGLLTIPKGEGKYPAILRLPGAGVAEKTGDIAHSEQGVIILELGIHGIPVNMKGSVYADLDRGALAGYDAFNNNNKYSYFYRRVYLGCVKGIDFLQSLPQCNGIIGTIGGSQGGALSIVTSRLDSRVKATAIYFPAICDQEAYIHGRAGCWPHLFKNEANRTKDKIETMRYYDASNFAKGLKAPVFYAFGYNDLSCPPTATYATYNSITAPKQLSVGEDTGHWLYPEQIKAMWNWLIEELNKH